MKIKWSLGQLALLVITCQLLLLGIWLLHSLDRDVVGPRYDHNYDPNNPSVFHLHETTTKHFWTGSKLNCLIKGTLMESSLKSGHCVCQAGYYGKHCSVPKVVWDSPDFQSKWYKDQFKLSLRSRPRRIIHALPISVEMDLLEIRLKMLWDVVDVFLLGESNYTNAGTRKELPVLNWLKATPRLHSKIVYVFQNEFPADGKSDGWIADTFMRRFLSLRGFTQLSDLRLDDLFVLSDADELIRPEVLEFLKLHDGYPEPVYFNYRWCIFGFFWPIVEKMTMQRTGALPTTITVRFFQEMYHFDASLIRQDAYLNETMASALALYKKMEYTVPVQKWIIGTDKNPAGWHCSWCLRPSVIKKKLLNAPHSDFPRWGDYPPKSTLKYIKKLIRHGRFFDLSSLGNGSSGRYDKYYAPDIVLSDKKYEYLVKNLHVNDTDDWKYGTSL